MKFFLILLLSSSCLYAQDLMKERIWKLSPRKRSIFLDKGIFHGKTDQTGGHVIAVRNSYSPKRGYERIVFDFNTQKIPSVYGHISQDEKKLFIDFFNTKLGRTISSLKNTKYVKNLDFFAIDSESLSVELTLKNKTTFDIFYLDNPGRLVVDIKR